MCGITAYLGTCSAFEYILASLFLLQNRGYDSAGICTLTSTQELMLHKFATKADTTALQQLERVQTDHTGHGVGIGHTRWATHGAKTDTNAHPHTDSKNMFAVVHNGIIENYMALKTKLLAHGLTFQSNTDTEVIAKLLEFYYVDGCDIEHDLLPKVIADLEGTWALVILCIRTPDTLYVCKNGSPLVVGYCDEFAMIASEQLPLSVHFNNYYTLHDGDILRMTKEASGAIRFPNHYTASTIVKTHTDTSCAPYPYWTEKEIHEQPKSIQRALNMGGRILNESCVKLGGLESKKASLTDCDHIVLLGCGTSLHAGHIGAKMLKDFQLFHTVTSIDASEFCMSDIPTQGKTGFLLLSQSGETKDLHRCMEMLNHTDSPIMSIVNAVGSLIARESLCGIYMNAGREVGVASTKSFTSQIVALGLFAIWFAQVKQKSQNLRIQYIKDVNALSLDVEHVLRVSTPGIRALAESLVHTRTLFLLGRGSMKFIAEEGALKIKEICYIHAEGYAGGSLKHGPFAMLDADTVVILIAPVDEHFQKMMNAAEEIRARHARVILITTPFESAQCKRELFETIITVPLNRSFQGVVSIIPIQLLAYEIAVRKGYNPDFPRNLAKVVTVDG